MAKASAPVIRFAYRVYCKYQGASKGARPACRTGEQRISQRLSLLPAELLRYLPDRDARVSPERATGAPNVLQIVVLTLLDEATTDTAFVRFIRHCNRAGWVYRLEG